MAEQKNSLYLLDGHAIIYRYYYAFKEDPLKTTTGIDTGAVWGMAKIVLTLLKNYPLTHIAVIFDPPYRTWRKDFYPQYKANRGDRDDISPQLDMAFHLLKTWGIYTGAFRPLEADDVIGILALQSLSANWDTVIVTKDKDFAQLVCPSIRLLDLGKAVGKDEAHYVDEAGVQGHWGVLPGQIVDYLTLMGDASDNIPGVEGIGKKGAQELITKYGSIEGIYANLDKLTKSKRECFERAKATIGRDHTLVKLATHYQVPIMLSELIKPPLHNLALFELFEKWEFYSLIKELST